MTEPTGEILIPSLNKTAGIQSHKGELRDSHVYLLLLLVASITYAKSIVYQYTFFDDIFLLSVNHEFLSNVANISKLFTTDVFISVTNPEVYYRPLMNLLFMLELQISGNSLVIFHITNILLHVGCSYLLFAVFKQLKVSRTISIAAALLFCAHPINTSAVVWIPGRNDTLLALFVLASFWMFLRALESKSTRHMAGHMIFFFLALLTKETAFGLPLLTLTYVFFVRRTRLSRTAAVSILASYAALAALWYILRSQVSNAFELHQSLAALVLHWLHNSPAFILYLGKVLFPFNLSVLPNLTDQSLVFGAFSLLVLAVAYYYRRPLSNRELIWGLGWFFLFLAPTFLSGVIVYEHRGYCSLVGLLFAIAQLPLAQKIDFAKPAHILSLVAVVAFFGVLAMIHSEHFRNRTAFATNAFLTSPSLDESYSGLAGLYLDEGNYAAAEIILKKGIAQNPRMKTAHRMLGEVYAKRHEYALARREYETSIRLEPLQVFTYIDYGLMCLDAKRPDDAARLWKKAVFLNPNFLLGYEYLTNFYTYTRHDPDSAMMYARQIQQRGVSVLPELLHDIQENRLREKSRQ
jgi:protein O-mannosyl-transferase